MLYRSSVVIVKSTVPFMIRTDQIATAGIDGSCYDALFYPRTETAGWDSEYPSQ